MLELQGSFKIYLKAFLSLLFMPLLSFGGEYQFKSYSVMDGLPQSQVYDILLSSKDGHLYLTTRGGGLAKFDGNEFESFTKEDGLVNNFLSCLYQDDEGRVFIGGSDGFSVYNGINFTSYKISNKKAIAVNSICQYKNKLFLGTTNGLYLFKDGRFKNVTDSIGLKSFFISDLKTQNGQLFICHNKGLSILNKGELTNYGTSEGLFNAYVQTVQLGKRIFVGTYGAGVWEYKKGKFTQVESTNGLIVNNLLMLNDELWIATQKHGVLKYNFDEERLYNYSNKIGAKNCKKLCSDGKGNLWIGTSGGGVVKYYQNSISNFDHKNGLPGKYVFDVAASQDSGVWVSTDGLQLTKIVNGEIENYGVQDGVYQLKFKTILEDKNENLWLGSEGAGLLFKNDSTSKLFSTSNILNSNFITDVIEGDSGTIWVATSGGGINKLIKTESGYKAVYFSTNTKQKISSNRITCLHKDKKGRIWFGTRNRGLGCIQDDSLLYEFNYENKLSGNVVRSITEIDRLLCAGIVGEGIDLITLYTDDTKSLRIGKKKGLTSDNIFSISVVGNKLFVGTDKGVDELTLKNGKVLSSYHYGVDDGFLGVETNLNASCVDLNGNLWWGTINGLMHKKEGLQIDKTLKPSLSLTSVQLFYNDLVESEYKTSLKNWFQLHNPIQFAPSDNHIGFEFKGVDLNHPLGIKYQWKLEGLEKNWSPLSDQNQIFYSNLSPGNYVFKLKAFNKLGNASDKEIVFPFVVLKPFYQKWWFLSIIGFLVLGVVYLILSFRFRRVKKKLKEEKEKLEIERELIELEQKALRLQMNPHFIFNALHSIEELIRENDNKNARYSLNKFSKLMRNILDFSNESRIALEQEVSLLEDYLKLEKLTRENSFEYEIQIDENIDQEVESIPPMMLQPFVENSILHGVSSRENGLIVVKFSVNNELLSCEVIDNGIGREEAAKLKAQKQQQHKSKALEVTQARLSKINGDDFSSFKIEDVIENGEVKGTKVSIIVKRELLF